MKRLFAVMAVVALAAAASAASVSASDTQGPPCANITAGDFVYVLNADGTGRVTGTETLRDSACDAATYNFYVLDTNSSGDRLATQSISGATLNGATTITFDVSFTSTPQFVCIYGTTQFHGHLSDRAPDSGCLALELNSSGATGYF